MPRTRCYFYYLNERGHLFHVFDIKGLIENTRTPSGPTYLRDRGFLDFFYLRLQRNSLSLCATHTDRRADGADAVHMEDGSKMTPQALFRHFPYVGLCGVERNFLKVQDAPVVFTDYNFLHADGDQLKGSLVFGGSLEEPFRPSALTVTREGKLFHPITTLEKLNRGAKLAEQKGLVGAQVGLKLGFDFVSEELDCDGHYVIEWNGVKHVIPYADECRDFLGVDK